MTRTTTNVIDGPFTPNGETTAFPFTFEASAADEVGVLLDGKEIDTSLFAVRLSDDGTGAVLFFTAPTGTALYPFLNPAFDQQSSLRNQGPYFQRTVEQMVDREASKSLWLRERMALLFTTPMLTTSQRAGKFVSWDAEGKPYLTDGPGADGALRAELAATGGGALVGFTQSGSATSRSISAKLRESLSALDYGALGTNTVGAADQNGLLAALAEVANNNPVGARSIGLGGGIYRATSALAITLAHASLTLASDGKSTLVADDLPNASRLLDVDYTTGATSDFPTFNLTSIALAALAAPRFGLMHGLRTRRVIASKFTQAEFNNLNVAVEMNDDSNLNTFDTCMWRGNVKGWDNTSGAANGNIFLNCQWRYHTGTAVDFTGTDGNMIIGGDFEPYNAAPFFIADHCAAIGVRCERNGTNGLTGVIVRDECDLDLIVHSDGATILTPFAEIQGNHNEVTITGRSGTAAVVKAGAYDNTTILKRFRTLVAPFEAIYRCEDAEPSNRVKIGASTQGNGALVLEVAKAELVSSDLNGWTKTADGTTITNLADGGQRINWGTNGSLTLPALVGTFYEIMVAATSIHSSAASQLLLSITNGPVATDMALGNGEPGFMARKVLATRSRYSTATASETDPVAADDTPYDYVNPVFTLRPTGGASASGQTSTLWNLRTSANGRLPE